MSALHALAIAALLLAQLPEPPPPLVPRESPPAPAPAVAAEGAAESGEAPEESPAPETPPARDHAAFVAEIAALADALRSEDPAIVWPALERLRALAPAAPPGGEPAAAQALLALVESMRAPVPAATPAPEPAPEAEDRPAGEADESPAPAEGAVAGSSEPESDVDDTAVSEDDDAPRAAGGSPNFARPRATLSDEVSVDAPEQAPEPEPEPEPETGPESEPVVAPAAPQILEAVEAGPTVEAMPAPPVEAAPAQAATVAITAPVPASEPELAAELPAPAPPAPAPAAPVTEYDPLAALRREAVAVALRWAAHYATAQELPRIAALVADPIAGEAAADALAETPASDAAAQLVALMDHPEAPVRLRAVQALGRCGVADAGRPITDAAKAFSDAPFRMAALEAASRLGIAPTMVYPLASAASQQELAVYARAGLRAARAAIRLDKGGDAARLLRLFAETAGQRPETRAALLGLVHVGHSDTVRLAMGYLTTPGLHETAFEVLRSAPAGELGNKLLAAYDNVDPSRQAAILRVLAAREASGLDARLAAAAQSSNLELRVTAKQLLGQPIAADDWLQLARQGVPWLQPRAVEAYLDLAADALEAGDPDTARDAYTTLATDAAMPEVARARAVAGLGAVPNAAARNTLSALLSDRAVQPAAYAAYARLLAAGTPPQEGAPASPEALLAQAPAPEVAAAVLAALPEDAALAEFAAERFGYLPQWRVLGPFPNTNTEAALDYLFFNEAQAARDTGTTFLGESYTWKPAVAQGLPAVLDVRAALGARGPATAYAYAEITVSDWTPSTLYVGAGGAVKVLLNGKPVYTRSVAAPWEPPAAGEEILLSPGRNRLLVKLAGDALDSLALSVRLTDRREVPIDLNATRAPDDGLQGVGVRGDELQRALENLNP